jgi:molybdopterin molybdotransferase
VRVTGEQGSGILRSMSEANCFIILPTDQGNVAPGTVVEVQVMEGVV